MHIVPLISTLCFCSCNTSKYHCIRHNCRRNINSSHKLTSSSDDSLHHKKEETLHRKRKRNLHHWGIELPSSSSTPPTFPHTFDDVADAAYNAIHGTMYGMQRPDPNAVSNAMHKSVLDYRPVQPFCASEHSDDADLGNSDVKSPNRAARLGIEIDGASYLLTSTDMHQSTTDEGRAMRILSLKIAERLANLYSNNTPQSVAVYYNSIEQTLLASDELRRQQQSSHTSSKTLLDKIQILCIGQHLPENMLRRKKKEATTGIILIVKPTDYNYDSASSAIHTNIIDKLQSLLFQASASSVPAVVISPRLSELAPLQQQHSRTRQYYKTGPVGFEQSGYQKSATYGGHEPPVGPTSWLLRDLIPPVYVWVGCSLDLLDRTKSFERRRRKVLPSVESLIASYNNQSSDGSGLINHHEDGVYSFYSRVSLTQSSMDIGHLYHLFAVRETAEVSLQSMDAVWTSSHEFMGSAKASWGRPTREVMTDVFVEWSGDRAGK